MTLTLPDKSVVSLDKETLRFHSIEPATTSPIPEKVSVNPSTGLVLKANFGMLAGYLQTPRYRFGDCFRRISDHPRYSPKGGVYNFDVTSITKIYKFPGNYQGGTFCSSETEWRFLDGGIISRNGYGFGSHSWTVVQGAEALRALCMFFGIQQPLAIKGEKFRQILRPNQQHERSRDQGRTH